MKIPFLKPRYIGARFDEHTLPVNIARDFEAYEELIKELAKQLYRNAHPDRIRVPKGFDKNFNLHFEGMVEEGSAIPLLACVLAGALPVQTGDQIFFDQARDLVAKVVECKATNQPLPAEFPRSFLTYFNGIGRHLKDGESVELNPPNGAGGPTLTPALRKELVLHGSKTYVTDIDERGRVEAMDFNNRSFRFRSLSGDVFNAKLTKNLEDDVRQACGQSRTWVEVKGQGVFNVDEEQQELAEIQHLALLPNQELIEAFTSLEELSDGWLDGEGVAPGADHIELVAGRIAKKYPLDLAIPFIAAIPDGSIYLEWITPLMRTSVEFAPMSLVAQLHSTKTNTGESEATNIDISDAANLSVFFEYVAKHGGQVQ